MISSYATPKVSFRTLRRQLRALGLDAPVDPALLGLDVLRSVLRANEFPLEFFDLFIHISLAN